MNRVDKNYTDYRGSGLLNSGTLVDQKPEDQKI